MKWKYNERCYPVSQNLDSNLICFIYCFSQLSGVSGPPSVPMIPRPGLSPISPACSSYPENPGSHRSGPGSVGPHQYDLQSPASNASSYRGHHGLPSVEAVGSNTQVSQAHSLLTNIVLSDSLLNLFKDHNFDSCTMCVCGESSSGVGNLLGNDGALYLPGINVDDEDLVHCYCGFSAVVNRKLSYQAGLFYEDEVDITGFRDSYERRKPSLTVLLENLPKSHSDSNTGQNVITDKESAILDNVPCEILDLIRFQCMSLKSTSSLLHRAATVYRHLVPERTHNILEHDGNEVCFHALEQGKAAAMNTATSCNTPGRNSQQTQLLHKWSYVIAKEPSSSISIVRTMKTVQPLLQEAVHKKRTPALWEATYKVEGPLTWRQFHRLAIRGK